jgi:hypothetical protein
MMPNTDTSRCVLHVLDGNIYELRYMESSRPAVDESMQHIQDLLKKHKDGETFLLIANTSQSGALPVKYTFSQVREIMTAFGRDKFDFVRLAIVYQDNFLMPVWTSLFSTLRSGMRIRSFPAHHFAQAVEWLLTERANLMLV